VSPDKRPIDQAVDYVLYAPIGFALEARRLLPSFVERGRQQVQMAKMLGQFAVAQGQTEAKGRLTKAQVQAESVLNELGLTADLGPERPGGAPTDAEIAARRRTEAAVPPAAAPRSGAGAADLVIADYDSLAASQVIPRLTALDDDELEAVRAYEAAHRGRKTILGKIAQIQGS
jgi:hypothetical protein